MKVLMVNSTDIKGGAARAAYRLHRGLIDLGVESQMLVQRKVSNDPSVITPYRSKISERIGSLRPYFNVAVQTLQQTSNISFHSSNILPSGLHKQINNSDADVVHLHWINSEMISIREISKIQKPIVWTLHDMWAFCGAEHYDDLHSPGRYKEGYFKWNRPPDYKGADIDRWTWNRKIKHWDGKNFNLVTPSEWLADCAKNSKLFKSKNIQTIPNGLDLDVYKPIAGERARNNLNIPQEDNFKYILFGAMSATSDDRKGYKQLTEALSYLKDDNYHLIIFGSKKPENDIDVDMPITFLGLLNDEKTIAMSYSAADVMVIPSLQDNLPNTAVEAMACGTPVAAFNIGGIPEVIEDKENGFLAEPYDPRDLAKGIGWLLEGSERNKKMGESSREKAIDKFAINKVAREYLKLYKTKRSTKKI